MTTKGESSKITRIINITLFVLFILFAVVQLNDPDPILWTIIYTSIAILALISNYKRIPKMLLWGILIMLLVFASRYFSSLVDWLQTDNKNELFGEMVYDKPYLEGTREFLGLIMSALVIVYLLKRKK